ncbi:MAG: hypothetical protein ACLP5H_18745 [Desulfomonilaceae bacterium]
MLNMQVLALALIPLLSGVVPRDGAMVSPLALLGIEERISADFIAGTWKSSDEFFRWGLTDKEKAKVRQFKGQALMSLHKDGTMKMVNLFRPDQGRWELSADGVVFFDPRYPERGSQLLPVKKRDKDRIWLLLPFAGGATGIGMVRVPDGEMTPMGMQIVKDPKKRSKNSYRPRVPVRQEPVSPVAPSDELKTETPG